MMVTNLCICHPAEAMQALMRQRTFFWDIFNLLSNSFILPIQFIFKISFFFISLSFLLNLLRKINKKYLEKKDFYLSFLLT